MYTTGYSVLEKCIFSKIRPIIFAQKTINPCLKKLIIYINRNTNRQVGKMAHQVKVLHKPDYLSLIFRTQVKIGENQLQKVVFQPLHMKTKIDI